MKKILLVLGILIFFDVCYFSYVNMGQYVIVKYPPIIPQLQWDLGVSYFTLAAYGALAAFAVSRYSLLELKEKLKKESRNAEKADIVAGESSDKIKSLEAKISTLEAALKDALAKK